MVIKNQAQMENKDFIDSLIFEGRLNALLFSYKNKMANAMFFLQILI